MSNRLPMTLARPGRRRALQGTAALGAGMLLPRTLPAATPGRRGRAAGGWRPIPALTLQAGGSHSIAQYFDGSGVTFTATRPLPTGVVLSADGVLSVAANAPGAVLIDVAFIATESAVAPVPAPVPPVAATGTLRLLGQYTMSAATNEAGAGVPNFGKHVSTAYRPRERAVYLFGGDGTSWRGVGNNSHGFHFGKVLLGATANAKPVFQHFYPYLGVPGALVPVGYDCAPFVYDSRRDVFWQIGGFRWGITAEGWRGVPGTGGVWMFAPGSPFGTWTQVGSTEVPGSDAEGMQAIYHPRLDMVIGVKNNFAWFYRCADATTGIVTLTLQDARDVGRWNALGFDAVNDELLFVTPANQRVVGVKLSVFPATASVREIATVPSPYSAYGQFPTVWVAERRELVCFYTADKGIHSVNVDTGAVTANSYPPSVTAAGGGFVTQAVHVAEDSTIVGLVAHSADVAIFGWAP